MENTKRLDYLDLAKGIGILLVTIDKKCELST